MVPSSLLMWLLPLDNLAKPGGGSGGLLPPPPKPLELPGVTTIGGSGDEGARSRGESV